MSVKMCRHVNSCLWTNTAGCWFSSLPSLRRPRRRKWSPWPRRTRRLHAPWRIWREYLRTWRSRKSRRRLGPLAKSTTWSSFPAWRPMTASRRASRCVFHQTLELFLLARLVCSDFDTYCRHKPRLCFQASVCMMKTEDAQDLTSSTSLSISELPVTSTIAKVCKLASHLPFKPFATLKTFQKPNSILFCFIF